MTISGTRKFIPPDGAVRLRIHGRIAKKVYRASCWALPEKRTDFAWVCKHRIVYRIITASLPPALRKAALKRLRENSGGSTCVCKCSAEVVK